MKATKQITFFILVLVIASCGAKKKDGKKNSKDIKLQIEERVVELTCECIEPQNNGLTKKEYEDARDLCLRGAFPTIAAEFNLTEENNPYGGMMQMLAAFDRIKDGLKDNCPRKE